MFGITLFGALHTLIGLFAVGAGIAALVRHGVIDLTSRSGQSYVWATVATCVTGLFIFRHGSFGEPHALAIVTLLTLLVAYGAERKQWFGRTHRYVAVLGYSLTLFFHMIPAFTETATRIPANAPLASGPNDPKLQAAVGVAFLVYLIVAFWQFRRIRAERQHAIDSLDGRNKALGI